VQRDAHGDDELRGWQVDVGDHLGARVLHLEAWVQFQEVPENRLSVYAGIWFGAGPRIKKIIWKMATRNSVNFAQLVSSLSISKLLKVRMSDRLYKEYLA
jgi:hypothetical protein